jgi:hypothetical protein
MIIRSQTTRAGKKLFPAVNEGKLAVLYCFAFLFIATRGSRRLTLDRGL